jgi:hypothetical protein
MQTLEVTFYCILTGKIACANVLSDLYAMGVTECDNMLMLLGVSTKMTEKERDVVVPLMMRGFKVKIFFSYHPFNVFNVLQGMCEKLILVVS